MLVENITLFKNANFVSLCYFLGTRYINKFYPFNFFFFHVLNKYTVCIFEFKFCSKKFKNRISLAIFGFK